MVPPARKVWSGDESHQFVEGGVRVVDQVAGAGHDLDEVVRRHVRGHAHGDAARAVHEQVGDGGGQHFGLGELVVVVRNEVDHVFVEPVDHAERGGVEAGLGVPGCGRAVIR